MGALLSAKSKSNPSKKTNKVSAPHPKGTISATDRAILDLKNARDRLSKYKANLQRDEKKLSQRAKVLHADGQINMALQLLKLRRYKLKEVEQTENQLLNLWQLVETIHSTQNEHEVVKAMKGGKDALEKLHKELTVDQVLELIDDIREQHDIENEINTLIGSTFTAMDDSEIEAEMVLLEKEVLAEKQHQQQDSLDLENNRQLDRLELPVVPTTKLPELPQLPSKQLEGSTAATVKKDRILEAS